MNKVFIFPYKESILTKKVTIPYHVFETRYRQMIDDSIYTRTPIAVVLQRYDDNYEGEICVAGIPHVLAEYPDGRKDIYITGMTKFKLDRFACDITGQRLNTPYDVYFAEELNENMEIKDSFVNELNTLKNLLEKWAFNFLPDAEQRAGFKAQIKDQEVMVNYCVTFLVDDIRIKKKIMESNSLEAKVQILIEALAPKEIYMGQFLPPLRFK